MPILRDKRERPMRDLRLSLTDRCNFRCRYCMPVEAFGPQHQFLPKDEILSFDELVRVVRAGVALGIQKVRLTGGEPLLRRGVADLVAMIASVSGVEDIAMTTNGILLNHHASRLAAAGLHRVTVSLDALDENVFAQMNGVGAKVQRVLLGIDSAIEQGMVVKVNMVVQKGVNDGEIIPMMRWAREKRVALRFIEYMDVGESNGWSHQHVVSAEEIVNLVGEQFAIERMDASYPGEVAKKWKFLDGDGEFGVISSVTHPFCGDCSRIRVSAEGKLFTCLFGSHGADLRAVLRDPNGGDPEQFLRTVWQARTDRYSEERGKSLLGKKAEMSYLGG